MTTATERWRILQNIIAQKGIDGDLWMELAKAESMIHAMDQGKTTPPPVPEINEPTETINEPIASTNESIASINAPTQGQSEIGKYDNI